MSSAGSHRWASPPLVRGQRQVRAMVAQHFTCTPPSSQCTTAAANVDSDSRGLSNTDQREGWSLPFVPKNHPGEKRMWRIYFNTQLFLLSNKLRNCRIFSWVGLVFFNVFSVICTPACSAANSTAAVCCPITCSLCPMVLVRWGIWWVCTDLGLTEAEMCRFPRGAVESDVSELSWA